MVRVTAILAIAVLGAAIAASVAAAPIWRRRSRSVMVDDAAGIGRRLAGMATRAWRHRYASWWGPVVAGVSCGLGGLGAGPVLAGVLAAYGATGFALIRGIAVRRSQQAAYRLASDAVLGLAADLRAGATLAAAWSVAEEQLHQAQASVLPGWRAIRPGRDVQAVAVVARRLAAATALAQTSGAPLADVLDRLDAHLRAIDRARSTADSQAAGARVSAGLLAAMPVAGVGLGVVVGVDASHVLLHTPLGAAAVGLALVLQLGGLAWASRLASAEVVA